MSKLILDNRSSRISLLISKLDIQEGLIWQSIENQRLGFAIWDVFSRDDGAS